MSSRSCLGSAPVNSGFVRGVRGGVLPALSSVGHSGQLLNLSGLSLSHLNGVDNGALPQGSFWARNELPVRARMVPDAKYRVYTC